MKWAVLLVVCGVHIRTLILAVVQLGAGPLEDDLEALGPAALILVGPGQAGVQGELLQQDAGAHAEQVQRRLVVHVALVGVPIFAEKEGPEVGGHEEIMRETSIRDRSN